MSDDKQRLIEEIRFWINSDINRTESTSRDDYSLMIDGCLPPEVEELMENIPDNLTDDEFFKLYEEAMTLELNEVFGDE